MDDRSFGDFIGALPPDVDAIFRATLNRSSGEPEELAAGYGATPGRSFGMLFNAVNVLRRPGAPRRGGGSLMVYAAAGTARALDELDDDGVGARFLADLEDLFPATKGHVSEVVIQRWPRGLPYAAVGRSRLQAALTRPLEPVHFAGDYLGTWYTDTACGTAEAAALAIRAGLPKP